MEPFQNAKQPLRRVAILSENSAEIALLQHILALCDPPGWSIDVIAHSHFDTARTVGAQLVLLSHHYGNRTYRDTLQLLNQHADYAGILPPIIVLIDEHSLVDELPHLAGAARIGVAEFLTAGDLSLRRIQTIATNARAQTELRSRATYTDNQSPTVATGATASAPSTTAVMPAPLPPSTAAPLTASTQQQLAAEALGLQESHQLSIDLTHRRVHLGLRAESLLGYESSGMFTLDEWQQMLDPIAAKQFNLWLAQAGQGVATQGEIVAHIRGQDGSQLPVRINSLQLIDDGGGAIIGANAQLLLGTAYAPESNHAAADTGNLTIQPSTPVENNDADSPWIDLAHSLPITAFALDESGIIGSIVRGDHSTTNAFPDACTGQPISKVLGIESADNFASIIAKTLNTGKAHQQTLNIQTAQGLRWYDSYITRLRGGHGLARQVLWSVFDITTARHAYQELLKNHDALTDMLNDAPVLFCQKDASGRYQRVNRTFCESFNVRADVIAGRKDEEIFSGETLQHMQQGDSRVAERGDIAQFTIQTSISGHKKEVHWYKFALTSHTSNATESITAFGFVGNVASATSPPTINPKIDSAPPEVGSGEASAVLTGAIGQDFKAIISSIVGYTELAMSQKKSTRQQRLVEYLNQVVSASERAKDLIIETSSDSPTTINPDQAVELRPLAKEIVQMLQPTLPSTLKFQADIDRAYGKAAVDPLYFQRIVMQLLVSARDSADPKDDITLRLQNSDYTNKQCAACRQPIDGSQLALTVETRSGNINPEGLQKMIDAAAQAAKKSGGQKKSEGNIIIMTHECDGHVLIQHQKDTIALHLLFKHVHEPDPRPDKKSSSRTEKAIAGTVETSQ